MNVKFMCYFLGMLLSIQISVMAAKRILTLEKTLHTLAVVEEGVISTERKFEEIVNADNNRNILLSVLTNKQAEVKVFSDIAKAEMNSEKEQAMLNAVISTIIFFLFFILSIKSWRERSRSE